MATLNIGQVCMKTAGREAGKYCVVIKKMDNNFVLVTGPKELTQVKRRRCNIDHLEPVSHFLKIKEDAGDKEVIKAYETAGILKKLGLKKPSPETLKERRPGMKVKKEEKSEKSKKEVEKKEEKSKKSLREKLLGKKKEEPKEKPKKEVEKKPEKKKEVEKPKEKKAEKPEKKEKVEKPKKTVKKIETKKKTKKK